MERILKFSKQFSKGNSTKKDLNEQSTSKLGVKEPISTMNDEEIIYPFFKNRSLIHSVNHNTETQISELLNLSSSTQQIQLANLVIKTVTDKSPGVLLQSSENHL